MTINENGGIFNAALRPTDNWDINGTVEMLYDDNAFTPVGPRQTRHYRVHTLYRPKPWATLSGAFNDLERHDNTNNNQAAVAAGDDPYEGPLDHVDHSRVFSMGADLSPNEHYGLDFNYAYSDVYAATNICYLTTAPRPHCPEPLHHRQRRDRNVCPGVFARGSTTQLADWFAKDFMDAPTQYGSAAFTCLPINKFHSNIGYRISAVNGTRFFNDARDGQRLAGLQVSVSLYESCLDDPSRIDLEGGIQLLRLRRGRSFRPAVLQHRNLSRHPQLFLATALSEPDRPDRTVFRFDRASGLSCQ